MGGSPPSAPTPTPPAETAAAQTGANVFSGLTNQYGGQVDVNSWLGNIKYNQDGSQVFTDPNSGTAYNVPHYSQDINLSPEGQQEYQATVGTGIEAGQQAQKLLGATDYSQSPDNVGSATSGITKQWLDQQQAYQQPLDDRQRALQDSALRNQGILPGTPAYDAQMRTVNDQIARNNTAALQSFEPIAYSQAQSDYLRPLSVVQGLTGIGTPVSPSMAQTPPSQFQNQPTNIAGITANYDQARNTQYQNQIGAYQAQNAGIAGIISPFARIFAGGMMG